MYNYVSRVSTVQTLYKYTYKHNIKTQNKIFLSRDQMQTAVSVKLINILALFFK